LDSDAGGSGEADEVTVLSKLSTLKLSLEAIFLTSGCDLGINKGGVGGGEFFSKFLGSTAKFGGHGGPDSLCKSRPLEAMEADELMVIIDQVLSFNFVDLGTSSFKVKLPGF
jgi:hypothetical protein